MAVGGGEVVQCPEVALAGQQQSGSAVVPDRARLLSAIRPFKLGEVVEAQQDLNALARSSRGVTAKARETSEVGDLVQREEQSRGENASRQASSSLRGGRAQ